MEKIGENEHWIFYEDNWKGMTIRLSKKKSTGEMYINQDDMAEMMGFKDLPDMLKKNEAIANIYLDGMNEGLIEKT